MAPSPIHPPPRPEPAAAPERRWAPPLPLPVARAPAARRGGAVTPTVALLAALLGAGGLWAGWAAVADGRRAEPAAWAGRGLPEGERAMPAVQPNTAAAADAGAAMQLDRLRREIAAQAGRAAVAERRAASAEAREAAALAELALRASLAPPPRAAARAAPEAGATAEPPDADAAAPAGAVPLPPPPAPAPASARAAAAVVLAAPAVRPPAGAGGGVGTDADGGGSAEARRCRAIAVRVQLGEEPSNAERDFLRRGCRRS